MKKSLLILLLVVAFLVLVGGLIFGIPAIKHFNLSKDVEKAVQSEFGMMQLSNELTEEHENKNSGCSYDYKVKATRCAVRYTSYYGTGENPVEELIKIDEYLKSLGWQDKHDPPDLVRLTSSFERGFLPSHLYEKRNSSYLLQASVHFLEEIDYRYNQDRRELFNRYRERYEYIYYISVSSDIITRGGHQF